MVYLCFIKLKSIINQLKFKIMTTKKQDAQINHVNNAPVDLKINFYQVDITGNKTAEYSFQAQTSEESLNRFCGTSLNRLFHYLNVAKEVGAKVFNFKLPVHIEITANGKIYDTGTVNEKLTSKLKVQRSAKGYKRFSTRIYSLLLFSVSPIKEKTFEQLIESLD